MSDESTSWLQTASQRMNWLAERQKVIAENIANSDTPNYKARDVESFESYLSQQNDRTVAVRQAENVWGSSMDNNTVVLEEQSLLAASTSSQYRLASKLYGKAHAMISMVNGK
ncbi:MAG: hypothetical protein GYB24_05305 [Rhodobacteraceae bacterium]|nr:hypothetical protein [Paracoccaceae bacterium]